MNNTTETPHNLVIITRPKADAVALQEILRGRGYATLAAPLLKINYLEPPAEFVDWLKISQALVMTSANGVRALVQQKKNKHTYIHLPVYAVGEATAGEAKNAGFTHVETAAGDVDKLADLIQQKLNPENGPVVHIAGSKLAGDLANRVTEHGFTCHRAVLYESIKPASFSPDVVEAFIHERIRSVVFYSPRTAESFSALVEKADLGETLKTVTAICLSSNVAKKIAHHHWLDMQVATKPTQDDLLTLLDALMTDTASTIDQKNNPYDNLLEDYSAEEIIKGFGGIRPMAGRLGVAVSTVQGWKNRNRIPDGHAEQIIRAATTEGLQFTETQKKKDGQAFVKVSSNISDAENTSDTEKPDAEEAKAKIMEQDSVIVKKQAAGFSLISIAVLSGALILQPYWSPAVEKVLDPLVADLAPNLAAARNENEVGHDAINTAMAPLHDQIKQLQTELSKATQSSKGLDEKQVLELVQSRFTRLDEQLQELTKQVNTIPIIKDTEGRNIDLAPIDNAVKTLQSRVDEIKSSLSTTESRMNTDIQDLQKNLAENAVELEQMANNASPSIGLARNGKLVAILIAAMEISHAIENGRPVTSFMEILEKQSLAYADIRRNVEKLKILTDKNIPALYQLQREFDQVAAAPIIRTVNDNQTAWVAATLNNLKNLISIRRVGAGEEAPPLSRAEISLQRGDLSAAIKILKPLAAKREDIAQWVAKAAILGQAETYLQRIRQHANDEISKATPSAERVP